VPVDRGHGGDPVNFANEIDRLATVMGFAAAGIAWSRCRMSSFRWPDIFLIGKFGIKGGDRVQVAGVTGGRHDNRPGSSAR